MSTLQVNTISESTSGSGVTIDGVKLKDNIVETDTINEKTSTSGVTIDGVLIKDGLVDGKDVSAIASGITNVQEFRLSANLTSNAQIITANWEEADTYGYGRIGNTMASASGIFTFPTTGFWLITHNVTFLDATEQNHLSCIITATTDNSSYNSVSISKTSLKLINNANTFAAASAQHIFDVTNTTTHKIRFAIGCENNNIEVVGNTGANYTSATFIRLGDT